MKRTRAHREEPVAGGVADLDEAGLDDLAEALLVGDLVQELLRVHDDELLACEPAVSTRVRSRRRCAPSMLSW